MAASKLSFKRSITDKLSVKGVLSEDKTYIVYKDENDVSQEVKISDLLDSFKNQEIEFGISLKSEDKLELITSEDDDEE